jgi:hypothetical protein
MLAEIAEHFIRLAGDGVTLHAPRATEEQRRATFLITGQRIELTSGIPIDRRICEHQREFEFCNRTREHVEVDGPAILHHRKRLTEQSSVLVDLIEPPQHLTPDVVVITRKNEARHFDALRWGNESLRLEEMVEVRECRAFRERK